MDNPSPRLVFQEKTIKTATLEFWPPFPSQVDRDFVHQILNGMGFSLARQRQEWDVVPKHVLIFELKGGINPDLVYAALKASRNLLRFNLTLH